MKGNRLLFSLLFFLFLFPGRGLSQGLTVRDVKELLELGYTENEIKEEIRNKGVVFRLDPAAAAALREAGAGEGLIEFLKSSAARPILDLDRLLALLREKKPLGEVLDWIASRRVQGPLSKEAGEKLARAGAPPPVLLALKGSPLTSRELLALTVLNYPPEIYVQLVRIAGTVKEKIAPSKALTLLRSGIPKSVLLAFREGRAPGEQGEGKEGRKSPILKTALPGGVFTHVGKRFTIRCPKGWVLLRDIQGTSVRYVFTPEKGKTRPEDVDVGVTLLLTAPPKGSVWREESPEEILEKMLPLFRMEEPDMAPAGSLRIETCGGVRGASQVLEGIPKEKFAPFRAKVFLARKEGLVYMLVAMAPRSEYPKWDGVFAGIFKDSELGPAIHAARGKHMEASALAEKYKGSVVFIEAGTGLDRGQGSGFIVSKDGYILTNWHVVWNEKTGKPHQWFTVRWDDSLKRPDAKAVYIGSYHRLSGETLAGGTIGGTDVALLKIPPGDYEPVPLTPVSEVKLGDPVVALGFPVSYDVAGLSLFLTKGVVVRFNRNYQGKVESFTTDAKITHGNSGGPCFDLETGGVIGLNTWGYDIGMRTAAGRSANNFVGYYFVCPSDAAMARFPLVADLGLPHDVKLDFFPTFELATLFFARGAYQAALEEADKAVEIRPRSPQALVLRGNCRKALAFEKLSENDPREALRLARLAEASFERAMIADPGAPEPVIARAALLLDLGRTKEAAKYSAQAVKAHPRRWDALMIAARTAFEEKKYGEAIAFLDRAKKISRDILPDPYILAGEIAYSREWYEEGKKEFEEAARIQPSNLPARMGVARFYLEMKSWDKALAELRKVKGEFPSRPEPVHKIAYCLMQQKKVDEALNTYMDAESMFKKGGIIPPAEFFLEMAQAFRMKGFFKGELNSLSKYLLLFGRTSKAVGVHMKLASLYRDKNLLSAATFHVRRAVALAKELKLKGKVETKGFQLLDPPLKAIVFLLREIRYPPPVVADLVLHSRLAYALPAGPAEAVEAEIKKLVKMGIPGIVIKAILESNKRFPPRAAGGRARPRGMGGAGEVGRRPGAGPGPNAPGPAAQGVSREARLLVGTWYLKIQNPYGGLTELTMTFHPNGKVTLKGIKNGVRVDESGSYSVSGDLITTVTETSADPKNIGMKTTMEFPFIGPNIARVFDPQTGSSISFQRVGGR